MKDNSQEKYSLDALHVRVQQLEQFRDSEVRPFIEHTNERLDEVTSEQIEQKEKLTVFKAQIKDLEKRMSWQGTKEILLIALGVFLLMYIIIKLLI